MILFHAVLDDVRVFDSTLVRTRSYNTSLQSDASTFPSWCLCARRIQFVTLYALLRTFGPRRGHCLHQSSYPMGVPMDQDIKLTFSSANCPAGSRDLCTKTKRELLYLCRIANCYYEDVLLCPPKNFMLQIKIGSLCASIFEYLPQCTCIFRRHHLSCLLTISTRVTCHPWCTSF